MSSNMEIPRICELCGSHFIAKTTVTRFCGQVCAKRNHKKKMRENKINQVASTEVQKIEFKQKQLNDKAFLSISEASQLLGASRMTIHRQIKAGIIKAIKMGSRTIIQRESIDNLFTV